MSRLTFDFSDDIVGQTSYESDSVEIVASEMGVRIEVDSRMAFDDGEITDIIRILCKASSDAKLFAEK